MPSTGGKPPLAPDPEEWGNLEVGIEPIESNGIGRDSMAEGPIPRRREFRRSSGSSNSWTNEMKLHTVLELHNHLPRFQTIWMEPWGEELAVPPGVTWRLVSIDVPPAMIAIEFHPEGTAVYGIRGAMMRLYAGEEVVWESLEPFDPPDPA